MQKDTGKVLAVPNYKDSVFRMLFSDRRALLNLYNGLNGTHYDNPDELEINTLENAIYLGRRNDISFIIHSQLHLYEHQSTVNPNMPLRNLFYLAGLYMKMTRDENIYSTRLIRLPDPQFVVFYNGKEKQPARKVLRLSDAFEVVRKDEAREPDLELKVLMVNINRGYNEELLRNCQELYGYMVYVGKVRLYAQTTSLEQAVEKAIQECISEGILRDFLMKNRAEVIQMSIYEYDQEKHFRQIAEENLREGWQKGKEEGRAEGRAEGKSEGRAEGIKALIETCSEFSLTRDETADKICEKFGLDREKVETYLQKYWR